MHRHLAASLAHVCEEAEGVVDFDASPLSALLDRIENGGRVSPAVFAYYYDLVMAIARDDLDEASRLFRAMADVPAAQGRLTVMPIGDPSLSQVADLYRRKMDTDPTTRFEFLDPPPDLVPPFVERFSTAMDLFDRTIPELSGEVRGLISEVLLAVGRPGSRHVFDGGSSYMLWGALFLNPTFHQNRIQMAEVIAHECAHTLLFGYTVDEPLVHNPDDQLFPSPLRRDPRPMDGIYHATFVSARMHWVMTTLAGSGHLQGDEAEAARDAAESDRRNFWAGYETVERHAEFSPTGEAVMAAAADYMRSAA